MSPTHPESVKAGASHLLLVTPILKILSPLSSTGCVRKGASAVEGIGWAKAACPEYSCQSESTHSGCLVPNENNFLEGKLPFSTVKELQLNCEPVQVGSCWLWGRLAILCGEAA